MLRVWMSYLFAALIALQSVVAIADSHPEHQQENAHTELAADSAFLPEISSTPYAEGHLHQDLFSEQAQENEAAHPDCHHGHCHHPVQVFLALQTDKLNFDVSSQLMAEATSSYLSALLAQDQRPPIA